MIFFLSFVAPLFLFVQYKTIYCCPSFCLSYIRKAVYPTSSRLILSGLCFVTKAPVSVYPGLKQARRQAPNRRRDACTPAAARQLSQPHTHRAFLRHPLAHALKIRLFRCFCSRLAFITWQSSVAVSISSKKSLSFPDPLTVLSIAILPRCPRLAFVTILCFFFLHYSTVYRCFARYIKCDNIPLQMCTVLYAPAQQHI